jgi:hypothetical protein
MIRHGYTWIALGLLAALVLLQVRENMRLLNETEQPAKAISALVSEDQALGTALAAADAGDTRPLTTWLVRSPDLRRQRLARLILASSAGTGSKAIPDDRSGWAHRHRLLAFLELGTGLSGLDAQIDNALAYTLAMGTGEQPAASDLAIAVRLAERLDRRLRVDPDHSLWDTVGCVRFLQGDFAKAKDAFTAANDLLAKRPADEPGRSIIEPLYRQRLEAAAHNLNPPPNTPLRALPRDLRP